MKTRRLNSGLKGLCHDCDDRARFEVTFAHRTEIRLCDRWQIYKERTEQRGMSWADPPKRGELNAAV
jgi:hypothetical protein